MKSKITKCIMSTCGLLLLILGQSHPVSATPIFPSDKLNAIVAVEAAAESFAVITTFIGLPVGFTGQWNGFYDSNDWSMDFSGASYGDVLDISLGGSFCPAGVCNPVFDSIEWTGTFNFAGSQVATTSGSAVFVDSFDWNHFWDTAIGVGGIIGVQALTGIPTGGTVAIASVAGITGVIAREPIAELITTNINWNQDTGEVMVALAGDTGSVFSSGIGTIEGAISMGQTVVPEPSTQLLLGSGLVGLGGFRIRRKRLLKKA